MTINAQRATTTSTIVDSYLAGYCEPDDQRRAELLSAAWAEDGRLIDPPLTGEGHAGIEAAARALQQQFPAHRFRRTSGIDAHHDQLRFGWELVSPGGDVVLDGVDVGELAPDGRLRRIVGFFGSLSPAI